MKIRLLHDREFVCVTEDIFKKHSLKVSPLPSEFSHSTKASILINQYPAAAVRLSLQSLSTESLISASVTQRIPVKLKGSWSFLQPQAKVPEFHQEHSDS